MIIKGVNHFYYVFTKGGAKKYIVNFTGIYLKRTSPYLVLFLEYIPLEVENLKVNSQHFLGSMFSFYSRTSNFDL